MKDFDTVLVGFDHSHGDPAILIVGRKAPGDNVRIINQFQGKEAEELYRNLVGEEKKAGRLVVGLPLYYSRHSFYVPASRAHV